MMPRMLTSSSLGALSVAGPAAASTIRPAWLVLDAIAASTREGIAPAKPLGPPRPEGRHEGDVSRSGSPPLARGSLLDLSI